ncbi:MAG: DUF4292 domain-containing protein [Candidatus Manganitrophaceae bacterium]
MEKRLIRSGLLLGLVVLLFVSGCAKKQLRPTEERVKKDASLEELTVLYRLRREEWNGFKGLLEITTETRREGRHTFQATWLLQGGQTRIRGFDILGGTLFELRLAGSQVVLTLAAERRTIETSRREFESQPGAAMPIGSLALLDWVNRGAIPEATPPLLPVLEKGEERFFLYLLKPFPEKGILEEKISIERTAFRVDRVETFDLEGSRRAVVTFDDYRKVGGREFPFDVQGEERGEKISLRFKEVSPLPRASAEKGLK